MSKNIKKTKSKPHALKRIGRWKRLITMTHHVCCCEIPHMLLPGFVWQVSVVTQLCFYSNAACISLLL